MTPYHRQDNYTVDGNAVAEADVTGSGKGPYEVRRSQSQSEFGDSLYSAVTTKPVGSGGEKSKRNSGRIEENLLVFIFLSCSLRCSYSIVNESFCLSMFDKHTHSHTHTITVGCIEVD